METYLTATELARNMDFVTACERAQHRVGPAS